jgi:hypothetical protein
VATPWRSMNSSVRRSTDRRRGTGEVLGQYREAIVGSIIGVIIEFANYFMFRHSPAGSLLALLVAILGILLALLRSALQLTVQDALQPVEKLAEIVDLQAESNIGVIGGLLQRYLTVTETQFRPVKEQIVADATEKLRRLAVEKRSAALQTTDYYDWLKRELGSIRPGEYMRAVSLSSDEEWNDSQLEKNFLSWNLEAAARGALISRIFVVEEARLAAFLQIPPIRAHTVEADTGMVGYYLSRDYLQRADRDVLAEIGEGFIDFNGHVGLEDRFDPTGKTRGEVTMLPSDLDKMQRIYQRLLNMSEPLSTQLVAKP